MKTVAVTQLIDNITALIGIFATATASTNAFSGAIAVLNAIMEVNPVFLIATAIAGLVEVVKLAVKAFDYFNVTAEESREELSKLRQESENSENSIKSLRNELQETNDKIKEIQSQKLEITNEKDKQRLDDELIALEAQSAELRTQLRIQEQINAEKHREEEDTAVAGSKKNEESFSYSSASGGYWESIEGTAQEQMEQSLQRYTEYTSKIKELNLQLIQANKDKDDNLVQSLSQDIAYYEDANNLIQSHMTDLASIMITQNESIYGVTEAGKELKDSNNDLLESYETLLGLEENGIDITSNLSEQFEELASKTDGGEEAIKEFAESNGYLEDVTAGTEEYTAALIEAGLAMQEEANQAGDYVDKLTNVSENLKSLSEEYNSLKTAVKDFNDGNTLSLDSLDTLITAVMNHSNALSYDNGQLVLSEQYYEDLANAQIDEAEATLMTKAQHELASIAAGEYADILAGVATASDGAATSSTAAGDAAYTAGENAKEGAKGFREFWAAVQGEDYKYVSNHNQFLAKKVVEENTRVAYESLESMRGKFKETSSSVAKSSKGSSKESKDAWLEAYKSEKDALESLYKTNVITAEEYAQKLGELSDKYLTDSTDHQKKYAKEIHDAYEAMYTALKKSAKEALDEEEKRLKKQLDDIKDEAKAREKDLKRAHDSEEKAIKKKIDTQKEYNKEVLKGIKSQIDALKREKDATKDSYNKRIDTLKTEREEYERQVKLMQLKEELAKAKSTMQYVMDETGKFTYQEDSTAVDQAQENLIEEERKQQYERELSALEDARDNADEIYEQRIQSLEDYYDSVKEQQDKAIDQMEKYLDEVKDRHDQEEQALSDHYDALEAEYERNYNDFKDNADKYLNGQMQLTNNENSEWGRRLQNLANFVNEYNALMNSLNNGSTSNSSNYKGSSSSGSSIKSSSKKSSSKKKASKKSKRASGDASISSDGMYLVGDSPNQELVIGSKLNGVPLSLSRGDGVVNAKSTKTLAGILNMIGGLAKPLAPNQTNNNSTSNITISNVSLPNVHNGEEFINCLQHFDIDMMQRSYDTY